MKHFLKPLSHCLTTAVITSALLDLYSLPAVEASVPEPTRSSTAENTPSERLTPPAPEPPVAISAPEAAVTAEPVLDAPAPEAAAAPQVEAPVVEKPEVNPASDTQKASPAAAQKPAETDSARTVAGMRQVLEKRLADLAQQNKDTRNAQWQENLSQTAIQSAWNGNFEQARRIAVHPALPSAIQADLLAKIAVIEVQWQTAQLARQLKPGQSTAQNSAKPGTQTATQPGQPASGRIVPSGSVPNWVSSLGVSPGNQCLALQTPGSPAVKPAQPTARPTAPATAQAKTPKGDMPAFVPALSQNLAARLAQASQQQANQKPASQNQAAKPSVRQQPLVSPTLFTGVATSSSFRVIAEAARPTSPAQVMAEIPTIAQPTFAQPPITATTPAPKTAATAPAGLATSTPEMNPSALAQPLEQAEATFTHFLPYPFNLAWNWWATPEKDVLPTAAEADSDSASADFVESLSADPIAFVGSAQMGLHNYSLFQSWSQDLTQALQPARSAFKLSIPSLAVAKTVNAKTPTYDTAALLAMSCNNAQLASQFSSYVVDPATSQKMGWVNLMFPLPIPAVVTSLFGWRIHPISGNLSFHTGLDLGAPMGTPVLAAQPGRVVAADYMGGYGLAVVIENASNRERNLYGHLSGIAVQPGAQISQGTVLGWVGSTGNSTGPHLHFETMVHTESGWTAIDPLASAAVSIASSGRSEGTR